jgi:hypothetical protein
MNPRRLLPLIALPVAIAVGLIISGRWAGGLLAAAVLSAGVALVVRREQPD